MKTNLFLALKKASNGFRRIIGSDSKVSAATS